jgi:methionyl-tRNA formyltransferase
MLAAEKILDNIDDILEDKAKFIEQDHSKATYAKKIDKKEGQIDWRIGAPKIIGKINGLFLRQELFLVLMEKDIKF